VPVISSFSWHIKTATESRQVIVTLMYCNQPKLT
jgi:hypothetical protein